MGKARGIKYRKNLFNTSGEASRKTALLQIASNAATPRTHSHGHQALRRPQSPWTHRCVNKPEKRCLQLPG